MWNVRSVSREVARSSIRSSMHACETLFLSLFCSGFRQKVSRVPADPATSWELQNPSCDISKLHKIRQSPDREAFKYWKWRSGWLSSRSITVVILRLEWICISHYKEQLCYNRNVSNNWDAYMQSSQCGLLDLKVLLELAIATATSVCLYVLMYVNIHL